jgi:hypothetical protein
MDPVDGTRLSLGDLANPIDVDADVNDTDSESGSDVAPAAPMDVTFLTMDQCMELARNAVIADDPEAIVDLTTQVNLGNSAAAYARAYVTGEQRAQRIYDQLYDAGSTAEAAEAARQEELACARSTAEEQAEATLSVTQYREDGYRDDDGGLQPLLPQQITAASRASEAVVAMQKRYEEVEAAKAAAKAKRISELGPVGATIADCVEDITGKCPLCYTPFHLLPHGERVVINACDNQCALCSECHYDHFKQGGLLTDHVINPHSPDCNTANYNCPVCQQITPINDVVGFEAKRCRLLDGALESLRRTEAASTIDRVQSIADAKRLQELEERYLKLKRTLDVVAKQRDAALKELHDQTKRVNLALGGVIPPRRSNADGKRPALAEPIEEGIQLAGALAGDEEDNDYDPGLRPLLPMRRMRPRRNRGSAGGSSSAAPFDDSTESEHGPDSDYEPGNGAGGSDAGDDDDDGGDDSQPPRGGGRVRRRSAAAGDQPKRQKTDRLKLMPSELEPLPDGVKYKNIQRRGKSALEQLQHDHYLAWRRLYGSEKPLSEEDMAAEKRRYWARNPHLDPTVETPAPAAAPAPAPAPAPPPPPPSPANTPGAPRPAVRHRARTPTPPPSDDGAEALSVASAIDAMAEAPHMDDDHGMGHAPSDDEEVPDEEVPGHYSDHESLDDDEEEENAAARAVLAGAAPLGEQPYDPNECW